ncbi:DNA-methyltransferase [Streptomyces sp. B21-083]|uniref:DNA-methyltransferase n=1 Tax=Streptomyces sp. B21-083 TaxID=3039410 RepID=UPI002FEFFE7C
MSPPPYYQDEQVTLLLGDALQVLRELPSSSVDCVVTSPPYFGLRDYNTPGQYGMEAAPEEFISHITAVFAEARRVLADTGTLWLNLGDSYGAAAEHRSRIGLAEGPRRPVAGRRKSLLMIPERVSLALLADGWILRNKVAWRKTSCMPEAVTDRLSRKHEPVYFFTKHEKYAFDLDAIRDDATSGATWGERKAGGAPGWHGPAGPSAREAVPSLASHANGANPGDVWDLPTATFAGAHFAVMPTELALRCIKAGCRQGGTVLDPFSGSGTTGAAARQLGRRYVGVDLNPAYHDLARARFAQGVLDFDATA